MFWQEIKEEPKVWFGIDRKEWTHYVVTDDEDPKRNEPYFDWFETQKERDQFVLDNKPQFTGRDMKEFADYYYKDSFDAEMSFNNWLRLKQNENGTN